MTVVVMREEGVVSPVKNQGQCGACWAFSATEMVESAVAIAHNSSAPWLAVQQLIDCSRRNSGCGGGDICVALDYIKTAGISYEENYPLTDHDGTCRSLSPSDKVVRIASATCRRYFNDEKGVVITQLLGSFIENVATAQNIFAGLMSLIEPLEPAKCLPKENIVSCLMDNCNVMRGKKGGLETLIRDEQPHLLDVHGEDFRRGPCSTCWPLYVGQEGTMLHLLATVGPVSVAVDASTWNNYVGGVVQFHCSNNTNHAVDIVGYDLTGSVPYYIVRNSWGEDFGMGGYLYIKVGGNLCGIAEEVANVSVL
ncbi:hypothetical protein ACOMHN_031494 [Nucella lapillus]